MTKDIMWFKTRVSLVSIAEPAEILVHHSTKGKTWSIYACLKAGPEMSVSGPMGIRRGTVTNPSCHLATFSDAPGVGEAIAVCMAQIETAIRAQAGFCDLSQSGDALAWGKEWEQIQWLTRRA